MLTMVHVKVVGKVKDIVEVVADKNVYKVKEISRELIKEVKDMVDHNYRLVTSQKQLKGLHGSFLEC